MIPDKIYIREYPDVIAHFWEEKKKEDVVATIPHEYIRKDALIEWAKDNRDSAGKLSYTEFLDKINSI